MTAHPIAAPVDAETAALLALIAGDPIHATDRATITAAIVEAARQGHGVVSMNWVRARLWNEHGSVVYPKVIGAVVASLRHQGVLVPAGMAERPHTAAALQGRTHEPRDRGMTMDEKTITACSKRVGSKPWWMGSDQYDPCHCLLAPGHEGECKCSHAIDAEATP